MTDKQRRLVTGLEQAIFSVRWMLIPLYAGLVAALGLYIVHFIHEIILMFHNYMNNYEISNILMLSILELVDMTMISQLVVMTIQGGYSIFVREFDYSALHGRPRWLSTNFGSSEQKIKMGMSIIGVMVVHFLRDFIQSNSINENDLIMRLAIMAGVIIATFSFCLFNLLMHHPILMHHDNKDSDHEA